MCTDQNGCAHLNVRLIQDEVHCSVGHMQSEAQIDETTFLLDLNVVASNLPQMFVRERIKCHDFVDPAPQLGT